MIRNWYQFNESQLDLFQGTQYEKPELIHNNLYPMNEDDIRDYLAELEDEGYSIIVNFGFLDKEKRYTESIFNRYMRPCMAIDIDGPHKNSNEDVTSCVTSFLKRVSNKFKENAIYDNNGKLDINDIILKGGIFIKSKNGNIEDELQIEGPLHIELIWHSDVYITDKILFEYYGFEQTFVNFTDKGMAQIGFPRDVISDWVVKGPYKDVIDDPDYDFDQWYYRGSEWIPDHDSFFRYHLENDTIKMLLEYCFKDFENIKYEYRNSDFITKFNSKDELINEVMNKPNWGRHWSEIGEFLKDSEIGENIYDELRDAYADWSVDAKINDDYKKIFEEFDEIVEKELETSIIEKFESEEKKRIKISEIHPHWKEITYYRPYYRINFNINWISETDSSDLFNLNLETHMSDWAYNCISRTELHPSFHDYADVDDKLFNIEARGMIKYNIEKK